jgi:L-fucose mutarotase/ribose pyranase (RbsD/FucU family)
MLKGVHPLLHADFLHALSSGEFSHLPRQEFYARAAAAFVVVRTGELRPYGNILPVKGVVTQLGAADSSPRPE